MEMEMKVEMWVDELYLFEIDSWIDIFLCTPR